jgi:hypothetical protein
MRRLLRLILVLAVLVVIPSSPPASAQTYWFAVEQEVVDVYWEADGTMRFEAQFLFYNDPSADPMAYVDVGVKTEDYSLSNVSATIDGHPITDIEESPYVKPGVALSLGSYAIPPGSRGWVRISISGVGQVLYESDVADYASALYAVTWFDSDYCYGTTDLTVRFHLPPGVKAEEPRWHASPSGWPQDAPETYLDDEGRVLYVWHNGQASPSTPYVFGASFPASYVPSGAIARASLWERLGIDPEMLTPLLCCLGGGAFVIFVAVMAIRGANRRKLAYLPPKIAIEGHGIKRGLTAVEAAILLETKLDTVLTMILFGLIKKGAARVSSEEPLQVEAIQPSPEDLKVYEKSFLEAMAKPRGRERERMLQDMMIELVKSVQSKMKGFSARETKDFYRSVVKKAWKQVEEAATPEVRSERYAEDLEWTMLDRDFDDRTRRVFRTGPVFLPVWWGSYRPSGAGAAVPSGGGARVPSSRASAGPAGRIGLPTLPGSNFAASMVRGVQNTAAGLVGNITNFTGAVTNKTNPPPPPPKAGSSGGGGFRSGGGSSCACACACACAGCACACAGGGR